PPMQLADAIPAKHRLAVVGEVNPPDEPLKRAARPAQSAGCRPAQVPAANDFGGFRTDNQSFAVRGKSHTEGNSLTQPRLLLHRSPVPDANAVRGDGRDCGPVRRTFNGVALAEMSLPMLADDRYQFL